MDILELDQLSTLDLNQQEKLAQQRYKNHLAALKQELKDFNIGIANKRVKEAEEKDPNYVHHKLNSEDLRYILQAAANIGIERSSNKSIKIKTHGLAIEGYAKLTHQHADWGKKIKTRTTWGEQILEEVEMLSQSSNPIVSNFYSYAKPNQINPTGSINQVLKRVMENIDFYIRHEKLVSEVTALQHEKLQLLSIIQQLKNDNKNLQNGIVHTDSKDWHEKAITLSVSGNSKTAIAKHLGLRRETVTKFLNHADIRKRIEVLKTKA